LAGQERIARPTRSDEWEVVTAAWDRWAQQEPDGLTAAYDQLATNRTPFSSTRKRLEGQTHGTGTCERKIPVGNMRPQPAAWRSWVPGERPTWQSGGVRTDLPYRERSRL
jgi:hypothetical protein